MSTPALFSPAERAILESLEAAIRAPRAAAVLDAVADEVTAELAANHGALLAWRTIPLDTYDHLPAGIASSWVFVLRAGKISGAERHPNSIQRVMSYRAAADMQTWNGSAWESHRLVSSPTQAKPAWVGHPENPHPFDKLRAGSVSPNPGGTRMGQPVGHPEALERRWLSIPVNVWHRPVMGTADWVVVSFHTAAADELIEDLAADDEHPDRGSASTLAYAGRQAR